MIMERTVKSEVLHQLSVYDDMIDNEQRFLDCYIEAHRDIIERFVRHGYFVISIINIFKEQFYANKSK